MKYLAVSDIHGSLSGAETVLKAFELTKPDAVLCLGDILYHGPRNDLPADYAPKQVIGLLGPLWHDIIAVRGNCEAEVDDMVLRFPVSADYCILPGKHRIFMSHGHIYGPDRLPELAAGDVFLYGHTHIPAADVKDGVYLLNPGSVSLPKADHPCTYGILDDDGFTVYTADHREYMHITF